MNNCFILFNKKEKPIGLSSSCITFLGLDNKILEQSIFFKDLFCISLEEIKKISVIGTQSFKINEILKAHFDPNGSTYRKDPYTITYNSFSDGYFWIELTVARSKS